MPAWLRHRAWLYTEEHGMHTAAVCTCNVVVPDKAEVEHTACAAACHPAEAFDHVGTTAKHKEGLGHQDGGDFKTCM